MGLYILSPLLPSPPSVPAPPPPSGPRPTSPPPPTLSPHCSRTDRRRLLLYRTPRPAAAPVEGLLQAPCNRADKEDGVTPTYPASARLKAFFKLAVRPPSASFKVASNSPPPPPARC
ncbi:hypothetical protein VPH35_080880 [Triticum aestivum]